MSLSPNPFSIRKTKPLLDRCASDVNTKIRLKFQPYFHVADANEGAHVTVKGRQLLMMCSNEYLGLSQHPKVKEAAQAAIRRWGNSPCGSRIANGSRSYHIDLEESLAAFIGTEACHVSTAGYLACMSPISTLLQRGDALIVDKSIHSALWDGAILCKADIERFEHENMPELERVLRSLPSDQPKAIVVDGVYSMEGHIASLPSIAALAQNFDATLIVDDAHGLGVLGVGGRGTVNHHGLTDLVEIQVGSFSKALGSTGGFIAASRGVVDFLRTNCRQIIFSAALAPSQAAAALASLQILQTEPEHLQNLQSNCAYYRRGLETLGINFWESPTAAFPIVVGDMERCIRIWSDLWDQGFFTTMAVYPAVPNGKDLIRTAMTALHTHQDIDRFLDALKKALDNVGVARKAPSA